METVTADVPFPTRAAVREQLVAKERDLVELSEHLASLRRANAKASALGKPRDPDSIAKARNLEEEVVVLTQAVDFLNKLARDRQNRVDLKLAKLNQRREPAVRRKKDLVFELAQLAADIGKLGADFIRNVSDTFGHNHAEVTDAFWSRRTSIEREIHELDAQLVEMVDEAAAINKL